MGRTLRVVACDLTVRKCQRVPYTPDWPVWVQRNCNYGVTAMQFNRIQANANFDRASTGVNRWMARVAHFYAGWRLV